MLHPAKTASATFAQKRAKIKVGQIASLAFPVKNQGKIFIEIPNIIIRKYNLTSYLEALIHPSEPFL